MTTNTTNYPWEMPENQLWRERDLRHVWHPCTQMRDHAPNGSLPLIPIARAEGVWLYDYAGNRYFDAISSWWTNLFGHNHPFIRQKLIEQLNQLDHVLLAGFSHAPAIELAEKLCFLTQLDKCFYADNGSSAVEVALKMSFHYWRNKNQNNKTKFVALKNSYHGETLGALAVGDVALYKQTYAPLLMDVLTVDAPNILFNQSIEEQFAPMRELLSQKNQAICAVIIEPLVQCAGNMQMYSPEYLRLLRAACDEYQVHLILDEIAVGFGRTGKLFAHQHAAIRGDMVCVSKGLTGGTLPLAAVLTTNEIYQQFEGDYHEFKAFLHSHSYTGNPLACATALATLALYFEIGESLIQQLSHDLSEIANVLKTHDKLTNVRQTGCILAFDLQKAANTPYHAAERTGAKIYKAALARGALFRPLGDTLYWMPPYVTTRAELEKLTAILLACLAER